MTTEPSSKSELKGGEIPPAGEPRRKTSTLKRVLKWIGGTILTIVLLVLAVITVAVNYLKPERLTPLVERLANEYLRADVKIGRMEISFWHTFPRFDLEVDALDVRTKAFDMLPDSVSHILPVGADSLLHLGHLSAAINIPRLLTGNFAIYDITLTSPRVNLVQATPEAWSLDIFPPSVEEDDKEDKPLEIPDISIGTFEILDGFPVRYVSLPDTLDVSVNFATTKLQGEGAPVYKLTVGGLTSAAVSGFTINRLGLGLGGDIDWSARRPLRVGLDDFRISVGDVAMDLNAALDFASDFRVESFDFNLPLTPLKDIIALIPADMRGEIETFHPEFSVGMDVRFTRPFAVGVDSIPSLDFTLKVPEGSAEFDGLQLKSFQLQATGKVDGLDLDRSVLSIDKMDARGEGMGFSLTGNVSDIVSDPHVTGCFKGGLSFAHLPKIVLSMLPGKVKGKLIADCDFDLCKSYLDKENFHRILVTGDATLSDFDVDMPSMETRIYSRLMELKLGTNTSFVRDQASADSLLTVSLKIDTISCQYETMDVRGSGLKAGVGSRNVAASIDTTIINPIGGRIEAQRFSLHDTADTTRVHLRGAVIGGALRRFKGNARQPQLNLSVSTKSAFYGDGVSRAMLSGASASLNVHPSESPSAQRRRARLDSLRRLYPNLSRDSLNTLASASRRSRVKADKSTDLGADDERLSLEVDRSLRQLLRQWNASGSLKAERMRLFTPLFPLRNRIEGLDLQFSTDSVRVNETLVKVGRSDFRVSGSVGNISKALTSRNGSQSLLAHLDLVSDTIDVNEIATAVFAGAAFADSHVGAVYLGDDDPSADEQTLQAAVDRTTAAVDTASVFIVPANLEAAIDVRAKNIIYSDLVFKDFTGTLNAFDGALNLSQLGARSDVGALMLNALYTAPTKYDASFAFDLDLRGFRIAEFLDLIPSMDTLMPMLQGIRGVINASVAATTKLDSVMDLDIPSLKAAVKISGDSLVVVDDETYRKIGKWLLFKHKEHNMIDSMTVEMLVADSRMQMFPFMFNIDRYKLGVEGTNDLAMNFKYHIAVLKSPIPFKFGINVSGNPDKMKIRLGRARFSEKSIPRTVAIADTTRINLMEQIRNAFRRGVSKSKLHPSDFIDASSAATAYAEAVAENVDTISHADSLYFIRQGLIPAPPVDTVAVAPVQAKTKTKKRKK